MSLLCVLSIYRCYFLGMSCEALLLYLLYQCSDGYSLPFYYAYTMIKLPHNRHQGIKLHFSHVMMMITMIMMPSSISVEPTSGKSTAPSSWLHEQLLSWLHEQCQNQGQSSSGNLQDVNPAHAIHKRSQHPLLCRRIQALQERAPRATDCSLDI